MMRVIAGTRRSLPLKMVPTDKTRPTADRIKETLFNMLNPYLANARFLDLFAGSGAIGIEALSRGAEYAVFVDSESMAVSVILDNLKFTKFTDFATVLKRDAKDAVVFLEKNEKSFDIIFLDPPYQKDLEKPVLEFLRTSKLATKETLFIWETAIKEDISFLETEGFRILKDKQYKSNRHVWFRIKDE